MSEAESLLSRRRFLAAGAGAALLATAAMAFGGCTRMPARRGSARQLNIFNWADYLHPDVIPEFQRRYGVSVVYDTFASNEALLARIQAGTSDYDLIVPSGYGVRILKKMGKLQPIDKDRLANFKYIKPRLRNPAFDPHCQYSLPHFWGSTGIGFNRTAFAGKDEPCDWDAFWDRRLAQRMTLLDDARETIGMALKRRGYSYNSVEEQQVRQAAADLVEQKPLVMAYTSDQVIIHLASGDSLMSLVFSGDAYQAARTNPQVRYVIPRSGTSIWVDSWCMPASAPHPDNAYLWLNYMLEPDVAAKNANFVGYSTPNIEALKMIDPVLRDDKNLYPPDELLDRCEELDDVGNAIFLYDRMWTEIKCA